MNHPIKNLPASVLQRLKNKARIRNQPFQEILTYYGLERSLYRISVSDYREQFVLKGALVMLTWPTAILRTTRDIDFRAYVDPDPAEISKIIREICMADVEPDGLRFDPDAIRVEMIGESVLRRNVRAKLVGTVGKVEIPLQFDLGLSDVIIPKPIEVTFPTILDFPAPVIRAYQVETVLAEKVEAIFFHGAANSRMNDFFDIWQISKQFSIEGKSLAQAMTSTFTTRGTRIQPKLSDLLNDVFISERSALWKAFLTKTGHESTITEEFGSIIQRIEEFIQPVVDTVSRDLRLTRSGALKLAGNSCINGAIL